MSGMQADQLCAEVDERDKKLMEKVTEEKLK